MRLKRIHKAKPIQNWCHRISIVFPYICFVHHIRHIHRTFQTYRFRTNSIGATPVEITANRCLLCQRRNVKRNWKRLKNEPWSAESIIQNLILKNYWTPGNPEAGVCFTKIKFRLGYYKIDIISYCVIIWLFDNSRKKKIHFYNHSLSWAEPRGNKSLSGSIKCDG